MKKKKSIDEIKDEIIKNSLFFLYFETDDKYIYHLDKIINYQGKFIIHKNYNKNNYIHTNQFCKLALQSTYRKRHSISHFNEIVHGNICQAIEQTKHLDGDYVEIGVYKGGSALTALNYMKYSGIKKKSYFLDTFDGFDYEEAIKSSETHWEKNNEHHKLWGPEKTIEIINNLLKNQCPNQDFELIQNNICNQQLPSSIKKIDRIRLAGYNLCHRYHNSEYRALQLKEIIENKENLKTYTDGIGDTKYYMVSNYNNLHT